MIKSIVKLNQRLTLTKARYSYYATLSSISPQIDEIAKATKKVETVVESKLFIRPFGTWLGVSRKDVIKEKGRPRYVIKGIWKDIETLIYKQKSKSTESTVQLHFFKGELFLVKSDFSATAISAKELNQLVYTSVCKKYINVEPEDSFHPLILQDKRKGRLLLLCEGFFPIIYYFTDSPETKELFKKLRPKRENVLGVNSASLAHLV